MGMIRKLLPHVGIILALMFITFFIVDKFNGAMNFIGNDISKGLLLVFSLVSIGNSCLLIHQNRKAARRRAERATQADTQDPRQMG